MSYAFPISNMGADCEFDALIYPQLHPGTLGYMREQFNNLSATLTAPAREFMQQGRELYELFNNSDAMKFARNVMNRFTSQTTARLDIVQSLFTVSDFQNAMPVMQRWIMANPTVREKYHNQTCDGYSNSYVDMEPGLIGEKHYDYRRVMDGVFQVTETSCEYTEYIEQLREGDRDLTIEEQSTIIRGWTALDYIMAVCRDDPTNPDGGCL